MGGRRDQRAPFTADYGRSGPSGSRALPRTDGIQLVGRIDLLSRLTLRPEFEVGPGGLKDGFVMVPGLGPSWSAIEVAALKRRLGGRAG